MRYPRGIGPGVDIQREMAAIPLGESRLLKSGHKVAILAFGSMVEPCKEIADKLNATLIDMRFIKPLDRKAIKSAVEQHQYLVTVEENAIAGGAGSGINELVATLGKAIPILNIGLADNYIQHGTREECLQQAGLDTPGIFNQINTFLEQDSPSRQPLSSIQ